MASEPLVALLTILLAFVAGGTLAFVGLRYSLAPIADYLARERAALQETMKDLFLVSLDPRWVVLGKYVLAPLVALAALALTRSLVLAAALGFVLHQAPGWFLKYEKERRRQRLEAQVLDLITSITTTIRSNMNLRQSIDEVAERMPAPMREEFDIVRQRLDFGEGMEAALKACDLRLEIPKLSLVLQSILVSERRGGDLAQLLDRIFQSLREIERVEERVKTETSGVRLTARLMAAMPAVVCFLLYLASPEHVLTLFTTFLGNVVLLIAAVLDYAGFAMIKRLGELEF